MTESPAVPQPSEALPLVRRARNPRLRASITSAAAEDRAAGCGQALRTERQVSGLSFHSVSVTDLAFRSCHACTGTQGASRKTLPRHAECSEYFSPHHAPTSHGYRSTRELATGRTKLQHERTVGVTSRGPSLSCIACKSGKKF